MPLGRGFMQVSEHELACRLIEAASGEPRQEGLSAEEIVYSLDEEHRAQLMRATRAAILYITQYVSIELVH